MKKKKSYIGWVYTLKYLNMLPDKYGILDFDRAIFINKKALIERYGNEWGKMAKRVKITIQEF